MKTYILPIKVPDGAWWKARLTSCDILLRHVPEDFVDDLSIEIVERPEGYIVNLLYNDVVIRRYTFPEDRVWCFFEKRAFKMLNEGDIGLLLELVGKLMYHNIRMKDGWLSEFSRVDL